MAMPCFAERKSGGRRSTRERVVRAAKVRGESKPAVPPSPPASAPEARVEETPAANKAEDERELRRGERVEFDGRLIEGQTAASGAIYLFERLPSELRSMVAERRSYRQEILETLYPNGVVPAQAHRADRGGSH